MDFSITVRTNLEPCGKLESYRVRHVETESSCGDLTIRRMNDHGHKRSDTARYGKEVNRSPSQLRTRTGHLDLCGG